MNKKINLLIGLMGVLPFAANAAVVDRGNGLVYDDVLNVTWAADFDLAATLGYNAETRAFNDANAGTSLTTDSIFTHEEAKLFADDLNTFGYAGINTWTLPQLTGVDLSNTTYSADGTTGRSYNNTDISSPLSHLHYVSLGAIGNRDTSGSSTGCYSSSSGNSCLVDTANASLSLFANIGAVSSTDTAAQTVLFYEQDLLDANGDPKGPTTEAWALVVSTGLQDARNDTNAAAGGGGRALVYAVGDVAAVPVPAAAWLFGSAMLGLLVCGRKQSA